jgi:hypothetical protein
LLTFLLFLAVLFTTVAVAAIQEIVSIQTASIVAVTALVVASRGTKLTVR